MKIHKQFFSIYAIFLRYIFKIFLILLPVSSTIRLFATFSVEILIQKTVSDGIIGVYAVDLK